MDEMNAADTQLDIHLKRMRQHEPQLADEQFTRAVMAGLPQRRQLSIRQKNTIILVATLCGSGLTTLQISRPVLHQLLEGLAANSLFLLGAAAVITYITAAAAVWSARTS